MSRAVPAPSSWIVALLGLLCGGWTSSAGGGEVTWPAWSSPQEARGTNILEKPLKMSIRMISDAEVVTFLIEAWNAEGLLGANGLVHWEHIQYESLDRVFRKVMDRSSSTDWILLGELQLAHPDPRGAPQSKQSFAAALTLTPGAGEHVEMARERGELRRAALLADRERLREQRNQARGTPGASGWWPLPWPPMTPQARSQSIARQRAEAEALVSQNGLESFVLVESETFLVSTDLKPLEAATLVEDLESMIVHLGAPLELPAEARLFPAKMVLIVCATVEHYRTLELAVCGSASSSSDRANCHAFGPRVTVLIHHDSNERTFLARLARQVLIAALHLHGSPAPLPRWLAEGLADHVAAEIAPESTLDVQLRARGLAYIRAGGDPLSILEQIEDPTTDQLRWSDLEAPDRGVARLVCSLLIEQNPRGFARWIRAVKSGAPWRDALEAEYGATLERVAYITRAWHRLND